MFLIGCHTQMASFDGVFSFDTDSGLLTLFDATGQTQLGQMRVRKLNTIETRGAP